MTSTDNAGKSANHMAAFESEILPDVRQAGALGWFAHTNRLMAFSRLICATVLLVMAATDPRDPGFQPEFDDIFALAYVILALAGMWFTLANWFVDFVLTRTFIVLDVLVFLLWVIPSAMGATGMLAAPLCLMAHITTASALRWRPSLALASTAFLNSVWLASTVVAELRLENGDAGHALRWITFAAIVSAVALWCGRQIPLASLPRLRTDIPPPGLAPSISTLDYALETSHASGAALCWIDREELGCFAQGAGSLDRIPPSAKMGFMATAAFTELQPMLFDLPRNRAIVHTGEKLAVYLAVPGYDLLNELGVHVGACVPVDTIEGRSWLILVGAPMMGWGHLQLACAIGAEIAHAMNWRIASENARDAALYRLRQTVARDLHDSVAHSLAGTRFLLLALRSRVADIPEVAEEIDSIRTALEAEHAQVRTLIAQLRDTDADMRKRDLIADIEALLPILASRWQIVVELFDSDLRLMVPGWLSLELQQILRETISNAVRHGKAGVIRVKCTGLLGLIDLEVEDDGEGFPESGTPVKPRSINERLVELGGALQVESRKGSTTLRMSIPSGAAMDTIPPS